MGATSSSQQRWTLLDIVESLGVAVYGPVADDGELDACVVGGAPGELETTAGVVIDAREVRPGDLFVALQGTRTHGIEHAAQAFERGACGVLAGTDLEVEDDRWSELLEQAAGLGPVLVATDCDGRTALGRLARAWRRRRSWRVVGITGSSGKTSTKDLLAALLERSGFATCASHANWNNEIGVPLTLLAAGSDVDVVICEMGMRGLGQVAWLCDVADPDIGIVTTAGTAHLELLGSPENIVVAKAELLAGTWPGGVGIFPGAQPQLVEAASRVPDRLLPFGIGEEEAEDSAVLVTSVERTPSGIAGTIDLMGVEREFSVPIHGIHQARNLAAAAAALVSLRGSASLLAEDAFVLDADVTRGFTAGRGERYPLVEGGFVIADAYNANPESMAAALAELAASPGVRRVAVLGRMAELGRLSSRLHANVGAAAATLQQVDELVVVGSGDEVDALAKAWQKARGTAPGRYHDVDEALTDAEAWCRADDVVLVKASNSSGLGRLVDGLVERHGGGES